MVQYLCYAGPDIAFSLYRQVFEARDLEAVFAEGFGAAGYGAGGGARGEDALDAGIAHFVVAFWVDFEDHVGV